MQPFGQVDDYNIRQHERTDLALPIVNSLIELYGGRIRIDSSRQRGITVMLTFPPDRVVQVGADKETTRSVA